MMEAMRVREVTVIITNDEGNKFSEGGDSDNYK